MYVIVCFYYDSDDCFYLSSYDDCAIDFSPNFNDAIHFNLSGMVYSICAYLRDRGNICSVLNVSEVHK